jgi:hypothetical protein
MRRNGIAMLGALSIAVGLTGRLLAAATVSPDLSDFNDDAMRDMDDTMKRLDSDIAVRDTQAVVADGAAIGQGLQYAQDYFTSKGNVEDAVRWAKQAHELVEGVSSAARAGDFETSLNKYDSLVKTCRACHNVYKPPDN